MSKQSFNEQLRIILNNLRAAPNHRAAGAIINAEILIKAAIREHLPEKREGIKEYKQPDGETYHTCQYCGGYDECDCSGYNEALADVEKGLGL